MLAKLVVCLDHLALFIFIFLGVVMEVSLEQKNQM